MQPLAERLRPRTLDEYIGQKHLVGEGAVLRRMIESGNISSFILWGPPGVGKTTLAQIIANKLDTPFYTLSAVTSGVKEVREVIDKAKNNRFFSTASPILFIDEIHRFSKSQQDSLLGAVEQGVVTLIGATTENPSFEVNSALLSRCKVFVLKGLTKDDIEKLLRQALKSPRGFGGQSISLEEDLIGMIASFSNGDARMALSTLEMAVLNGDMDKDGSITVTKQTVEQITGKKALLYDKNGEDHYNLISALHKSMRNSDPDASVYWLARMLEAGEDPIYIARRVTRFAAEDVGLADPYAMTLAISAYQACHFIGVPECNVHLTEAVIYMALAPKSNAMEKAYLSARDDAVNDLAEPVPMVIRNAPTKLMDEYYIPGDQGEEVRFRKRLDQIKKWHREHNPDAPSEG